MVAHTKKRDGNKSHAHRKPIITWRGHPPRVVKCLACGRRGLQQFVLSAGSCVDPSLQLRLYRCKGCGSMSWPNLTLPEYDRSTYAGPVVKFYVEQGAAVDLLIASCFYVPLDADARYLDIGCGFGFGPDFAYRELGLNAIGMDPGALAIEGRRCLGHHIVNQQLRRSSTLSGRGYDLLVASEVIEHVADPHRFVALLAGHLGPDGVLVLTTPNANAVHKRYAHTGLMQLLSPGWHNVLFSARGLRRLLQACGFTRIELSEQGPSLVVAATRGGKPINLSAPVDRGQYRRYLEKLAASADVGSWLLHGAEYRLMKELANCGDYGKALSIFGRIADSYSQAYQIDLHDPDSIDVGIDLPHRFASFAFYRPLNLCGVAFFRGIIALNLEHAPRLAAQYFALAAGYGHALRRQLVAIGADDGETEDLSRLARILLLRAQAYYDPAAAALGACALGASADTLTQLSAAQLSEARADLFVHLINLGAHEAAEMLEGYAAAHAQSKELPKAANGPRLISQLERARGLFELNHRKDRRRAALRLAVAERACRRWTNSLPRPSEAEDILWRIRYERMVAWTLAGRADRALLVGRKFSAQLDRERIPKDVVEPAYGLIAQAKAGQA